MAVAIKSLGFTHIKIYNGGIKDWIKAGHPIESRKPLPDYEGIFIPASELMAVLEKAEDNGCRDSQNHPLLTILDLRTENFLESGSDLPAIKTRCKTITCLLDDLTREEIRSQIPHDGLVVTLTETGNRDQFAMKYLYRHGFRNIRGLEFGMRGWIKLDYPMEKDIQRKEDEG